MADRRERITDFVRDVGGQPAERGELELLRLLARARHVLDEHYAELLIGARVEQPYPDVAPEEGEVGGPARRGVARAPGAPAPGEARHQRGDPRAERPLGREQALRLRVVLQDAAIAVEHQYPVLHVLDHQLVDARLRRERPAAL